MDTITIAHDLRKLVYLATTAKYPNFGGHHGIAGFDATVGTDTLRTIDEFIGRLRNRNASPELVEEVRAKCSVAQAAGVLSESDMEQVNQWLDNIKEVVNGRSI